MGANASTPTLPREAPSAQEAAAPRVFLRCRPSPARGSPELVVAQGDLTACEADAVVNPANSELHHGGGVAAAIRRGAGRVLDEECVRWLRANEQLPVGKAMTTSGGRLPCRYVIHTVGPRVSVSQPTAEHAQQLRSAVKCALREAERLGLTSIALPGISSGIFGYPRDLAAREIVDECIKFCHKRAVWADVHPTTLETIVFMNIDKPTCRSFVQAVQDAAKQSATNMLLVEVAPIEEPEPAPAESTVRKEEQVESEQTPDRKSGGILLVRVGESDFELLLGVEFRLFRSKYLSVLGTSGTPSLSTEDKERVDSCRRFSTEIGGLVTASQLSKASKHASRSVFIEESNFTLHIVHLDNAHTQSLSDAYERNRFGSWGHRKLDHLVWVPWRTLLDCATYSKVGSPLPSIRAPGPGGNRISTRFGSYQVSPLVREVVQRYSSEVEQCLEDLLVEQMITKEVVRADALKALDDNELLRCSLDSDWTLRVTSPPLPPPPPLQLLNPEDTEYKKLMSLLPSSMSSRVISVRRVRASARVGEFKSHKQTLLGTVQEQEPLFHGTPERWRATSIALKGFDLGVRLNGRAHGDGVYTSSDPTLASPFTATAGSLVHLRGLVTSNSSKAGQDTIVRGTVYVFPEPKALLPLTIADYAAEDERDRVEAKRKQAQRDYEELLQRRREMLKMMAAKEAEFKHATSERLKIALSIYSDRLVKLCADVGQDGDFVKLSNDHQAEEPRKMSVSRQFFLERHHFKLNLPVYEVKPELVEVLRAKRVVVVLAETGSGKSTQLPQLLLDDVLPSAETRRIAILEPRRVNAISLCKRVSEERGLVSGQEVGYTIGRGESNASPGVTRLEYMTHGLFVQLARNLDQLLSTYCAVIVDEAHERSVDVDLSLALLQRALKRQQTANDRSSADLRVIVTSATIGEEAAKFQSYLDPSKDNSAVFRIQGRTFPVHIEHRDDVEIDRDALGSVGVGKVLSSAAIQAAVELLRTTDDGNILVFLPGEGCINDALEVARCEISQSATIEVLDTFSPSSSAFCFRISTLSGEWNADDDTPATVSAAGSDHHQQQATKRRVITICVVGFHGKVSRAERDRVLYPRFSDWRLVVFTTNLAETGVTVPKVRYVIDTGLERRVRWNSDLDMNEMVTEPISVSSMNQRAGRAGRTASGICVRLYPEASIGNWIQKDVVPAVQNAMIYKAVLLNKELESQGEPILELLDPIAPEAFARAQKRLVDLGALDADHGTLSREGTALLRIGIDLRLGRFLIACARFSCLATGVKLASILVAADAPERLLPGRKKSVRTERLRPFIDPSGDHLTLLNILEEYERVERGGRGINWCRDMGFDVDVFAEAEASREYLLKVLDQLQFPLLDDNDGMELFGGKHACIRRALCAAYYDQLARPRMSGSANKGFTRVLDEPTSLKVRHNTVEFAGRVQDHATALNIRTANGWTPSDAKRVNDQPAEQNESAAEPVVKLGNNSTFWLPEASDTLGSPTQLVVFTAVILTDSSSSGEPSVQLLTAVSQEDVEAGAPDWCRIVDFDELLQNSARETVEFGLARGMSKTLLMNHGAWLKRLSKKFCSTVDGTIQNGKLLVSCPRRSRARVGQFVRKQLRVFAPESVVLQLPSHVNMGKLIGKGGQQINNLKQSIDNLLSSEDHGAGHEHVRTPVLSVDTQRKTLTITLQGASKPMMGVVVGRVQSAILEFMGNETLPLVLDASGERGQRMLKCPRLSQLLTPVPPTSWSSRDDIMLQLAHLLVWKCHASIHGGFLRDWVVRGEAANDIDIQLAPPLTTAQAIEQGLAQFLRTSAGAQAKRLRISKNGYKGPALALTIDGEGIASIDIDLVDRSHLSGVAPPGVDCDAGNLLLNRKDALRKKIESAGESLSAALENALQKRFVFFYPLENGVHQAMSVRRLKRYLGRGWTCVSHVPRSVQRAFLTKTERELICPSADAD